MTAIRLGLVAALLAAVSGCAARDPDPSPVPPAPDAARVRGMELHPETGRMGFVAPPGVVGIAGGVAIRVTEPLTIADVRPLHVDEGVEVLATRAVFQGRGVSPGGYRMTPGSPLVTCLREWPPSGHGASYPVERLKLAPGDGVLFAFYLRPGRRGVSAVRGFRIGYETADGARLTATGETPTFEMDIRPERAVAKATGSCNPKAGASWGRREAGFPP